MPATTLRPARLVDVPHLSVLIAESGVALSRGYYSDAQAEAMSRQVYGVDTQLIVDGTYYAIDAGSSDEPAIVACGGWSRRGTLFGSDHAKAHAHAHADRHTTADADPLLDPTTDAARIRAFFVSPLHARRGLGTKLMRHCASEVWKAGFRRLTLVSTMPGEPLYTAFGFAVDERFELGLAGGLKVPLAHMSRELTRPDLD